VKVVDANVLIYAVNDDADRHIVAKRWLDDALNGGATIGLSWVVLLAFLRLTTKGNLFARPLSTSEASAVVDFWLRQPTVRLLEPTAKHLDIVTSLLDAVGTAGNLVNDAHLAALSIEHRGVIVSFDSDFARFPDVRWERPA
jgi:toxin-antitoxin system PIN domain toxin